MIIIQQNKKSLFFIGLIFLSGLLIGSGLTSNLFPKEVAVPQLYTVSRVIDGDTIDVTLGHTTERIRLLGLDTPETVHPQKPVQCYGPEASAETKRLLDGKKVYLIPDHMSSDKDKYGRLLRYVFLSDGKFVNDYLIKNGYAYNYIYEPFQFMKWFSFEEEFARNNSMGLWEKCRAD